MDASWQLVLAANFENFIKLPTGAAETQRAVPQYISLPLRFVRSSTIYSAEDSGSDSESGIDSRPENLH